MKRNTTINNEVYSKSAVFELPDGITAEEVPFIAPTIVSEFFKCSIKPDLKEYGVDIKKDEIIFGVQLIPPSAPNSNGNWSLAINCHAQDVSCSKEAE